MTGRRRDLSREEDHAFWAWAIVLPSKTDTERLLVVSAELADVIAAIIGRLRDWGVCGSHRAVAQEGRMSLVTPAPLLFQRRIGAAHRAMSVGDEVELTVRRGSTERTVKMTLQAAN